MSAAREPTRDRILDVAQRLIQARGFSGFSYADVSDEIGITKASIHHHFPTKGALALALMVRYRAVFNGALRQITQDHATARSRLRAYKQLFANVLRDGHRLCMCGMFAADFEALNPEVRGEVRAFFDDNETWLAEVLNGSKRGELALRGSPTTQARVLLSAFEGAMLVARTYRDVGRFEAVADRVLADVIG